MLRFIAAALLLGLCGCSVVALHPLAGDSAAPADRSLAGLWKVVEETDLYRITQADEKTFKYCELKDDKATDCGSVQLVELGKQWYADIIPDGSIVPLHT